ncbi:hypothetical protein [Niabella aurantiaca]|uniref:hypothetical protein n=1 Tax=Niabella aurantiaca TaxID=379900 RepID=UPI0003A0996E|nr:hypothetical protein [Niabella aurantiaca]
MNTRSVFFIALLLMTLRAAAQEIPSRTNEGIRRTETKREQYNGYQKLKLTAEQKSRLAVLQKEGKAAAAAIRNGQTATPGEKREELLTLRQEQIQKQMALLTPAQQKIWKEEGLGEGGRTQHTVVVAQRNARAISRDLNNNGLPVMAGKNAARLNLSGAQQQKINELAQTFKKRARSVRQDPTLSAGEKQLQMDALKKEFRKKRKALLTAEQWQQWAKQDRKRRNISQQ